MAYLNKKNLKELYDAAATRQQTATRNFHEYERIFRGQPRSDRPLSVSDVTDQTFQAIATEFPGRVLPDSPEADVEATTGATECTLEYYLNTYILPHANYVMPLYDKCHHILRSMLVYGCQVAIVVTKRLKDGTVSVDFDVPYMGDVLVEAGARSIFEASYVFVRQYFTRAAIDNLIEAESRKKDSIMNIRNWKEIRDLPANKRQESQTLDDEKDSNAESADLIEVVKVYQRGLGNYQYWYHAGANLILGREKNDDFEGDLPIVPFYFDSNFSDPYGWGLAERLLSLQDRADFLTQLNFDTAVYNSRPSWLVTGGLKTEDVGLIPDNVIESANPEADVSPIELKSYSQGEFVSDMAQQRHQMHILAGSPDLSTPSGEGFPGASKAPAGVRASTARTTTYDNKRRVSFSVSFSMLLTLMGRVLAKNRHGKEDVPAPRDVINKLEKYANNPHKVVTLKKQGRKGFKMDWEVIRREFRRGIMRVDASWEFDKREQFANLEKISNITGRDRRLDSVIDPVREAREMYRLTGLDFNKVSSLEGETSQQQLMTPQHTEQMIEEALNNFKAERQQKDFFTENWKELPEDVKRQYLQKAGYQVAEPSPEQQEIDIKKAEAEAKGATVPERPAINEQAKAEGTPQQQAKLEYIQRAINEKIGDEGMAKLMLVLNEAQEAGREAEGNEELLARIEEGAERQIEEIFKQYAGSGEVSRGTVQPG